MKDFGAMKLAWLGQFFPYEAGISVDDTIARVMHRQAQNVQINRPKNDFNPTCWFLNLPI